MRHWPRSVESSLALPQQLGLSTGLIVDAATDGFDLTVEATGNEAGLAHALRLTRPRFCSRRYTGRAGLAPAPWTNSGQKKTAIEGRAPIDCGLCVVYAISVGLASRHCPSPALSSMGEYCGKNRIPRRALVTVSTRPAFPDGVELVLNGVGQEPGGSTREAPFPVAAQLVCTLE